MFLSASYDLCDHRGLNLPPKASSKQWRRAFCSGKLLQPPVQGGESSSDAERVWLPPLFRRWNPLFFCRRVSTPQKETIPTELILAIQHGDRIASMEHTSVIYCPQTMRLAEPWLGKLLDYLGAANGGRCYHSIQPKNDLCHSVHLSLRQNMFVYIYVILILLYNYIYIYITINIIQYIYMYI